MRRFAVQYGRCLCPPDRNDRHMCVHGGVRRAWLWHAARWWRVEVWSRRGGVPDPPEAWLDLCDTWADVLALAPELTVMEWSR